VNKIANVKRIVTIIVVLAVLYLNMSVDFTVLFGDSKSGQFVKVGAQEVWGLSYSLLANDGFFESDSNSDGLADGWVKGGSYPEYLSASLQSDLPTQGSKYQRLQTQYSLPNTYISHSVTSKTSSYYALVYYAKSYYTGTTLKTRMGSDSYDYGYISHNITTNWQRFCRKIRTDSSVPFTSIQFSTTDAFTDIDGVILIEITQDQYNTLSNDQVFQVIDQSYSTTSYQYNKYSSVPCYIMGPWIDLGTAEIGSGYTSYTFNDVSGEFQTYGEYGYSWVGSSLYTSYGTYMYNYQRNNYWIEMYVNYAKFNYRQGTYISTLQALDGTLPYNGRYTDEYWYVKGTAIPYINVISPVSDNTFCERDISFAPQISVSDADNDTLTCKYYIDADTTPRDTKTAVNTLMSQTVSFSAMNMNTLSEGIHTIKYEVSDGKATPAPTTVVTFKVDRSRPEIDTFVLDSDISTITVTGSAIDNIGGLSATPYKFDIGIGTATWGSATSRKFENLDSNKSYNVTFSAIDIKGHVIDSQKSIYTKAQVPIPGAGNSSSFMLDVSTTDLNPLSTDYQIKAQYIKDGVPKTEYVTKEGNLTASQVWTTLDSRKKTVKNLIPNTKYTFTMKARNTDNIETVESGPVDGTTLVAPPGSITNISAKATSNSITLSWDPYPGATNYDVLVNGVTTISGIQSTLYTHTGLGSNTQHTYMVRANIGTVIGVWSVPITKSTLTSVPPTPLNINAAANNTSIIITWDPAPTATTYQIKVDGVMSNTFSGTNYVHNGLTPGTLHSYQVRSVNSGGESAWSEEMEVTALANKPIIPANLIAAPGKTQVTLSWNGIVGESYEVEADGVIYNTSSTAAFTHKDLLQSTQHTYRVRSKRVGILSDWCAAVTASTSADVFGVPDNFKAEASDNMVELSWDAAAEATSYELEVDGSVIDNDTATNCIHLGLIPGSEHIYKVRAKKAELASDWSSPIAVTTFLLPTPENFTAATSQTSITLNWDSVIDATVYELEMDGTVTGSETTSSHTFTGLVSSAQHTFRVRAVNSDGNSAWSTKLTKTAQTSNFEKPILSAICRKNSITVMWNEIDGAASYDLVADGVTQSGITSRNYVHNGLTPGSIHLYRVKAVNGQVVHDWSDEFSIKTLSLSPEVPTNIEASSTTTKVLITWDRVANATDYAIEVDGGQPVNLGNVTNYTHSGLVPDTQHTYKIMSKNTLSESSAWSTPITLKTKKSTQSYTVDCVQDETFSFVFTASNLENPSLYTFAITYDAAQLEAVDLCAATSRIDTAAGDIIGSDIRIVQFSPGTIVFRKINGGINGQTWSGTVNSIKFKSNMTGQPVVQYMIN
jgi:hypothetical protein